MGRLVDVKRRMELLDRVVIHLGRHGLESASFRTIAAALDVSVNTVVHHFGSKDELVAAAIRRSGEIQETVDEAARRRRRNATQVDVVRAWWKWVTANPDNLAVVRLGIEGDTADRPAERRRLSIERGLLTEGVPPNVAAVEATLTSALLDGLVLAHAATGRTARITRAVDSHLQRLEQVVRDSAIRPV